MYKQISLIFMFFNKKSLLKEAVLVVQVPKQKLRNMSHHGVIQNKLLYMNINYFWFNLSLFLI